MTSAEWCDCGCPDALRASIEPGARSQPNRVRSQTTPASNAPTAPTRILRLPRAGEKRIRPVVDGNINETGNFRFQRFPQDGVQFGRMLDAKAPEPESLREIGEVRVAELRAEGAVELRHLLPPDATQSTVAEDEVHCPCGLAASWLPRMEGSQAPTMTTDGD